MNLERDGAPDIPTAPDECMYCRYFSPVGEGGSGFGKLDYDGWSERVCMAGETPTSRMTIRWLAENAIEEGDDSCPSFEEDG